MLIRRKILKITATRMPHFKAKMHQIYFGPTSKARGEGKKGEERERQGREEEGKRTGREGRTLVGHHQHF